VETGDQSKNYWPKPCTREGPPSAKADDGGLKISDRGVSTMDYAEGTRASTHDSHHCCGRVIPISQLLGNFCLQQGSSFGRAKNEIDGDRMTSRTAILLPSLLERWTPSSPTSSLDFERLSKANSYCWIAGMRRLDPHEPILVAQSRPHKASRPRFTTNSSPKILP
jgi:hypothetical protein